MNRNDLLRRHAAAVGGQPLGWQPIDCAAYSLRLRYTQPTTNPLVYIRAAIIDLLTIKSDISLSYLGALIGMDNVEHLIHELCEKGFLTSRESGGYSVLRAPSVGEMRERADKRILADGSSLRLFDMRIASLLGRSEWTMQNKSLPNAHAPVAEEGEWEPLRVQIVEGANEVRTANGLSPKANDIAVRNHQAVVIKDFFTMLLYRSNTTGAMVYRYSAGEELLPEDVDLPEGLVLTSEAESILERGRLFDSEAAGERLEEELSKRYKCDCLCGEAGLTVCVELGDAVRCATETRRKMVEDILRGGFFAKQGSGQAWVSVRASGFDSELQFNADYRRLRAAMPEAPSTAVVQELSKRYGDYRQLLVALARYDELRDIDIERYIQPTQQQVVDG